MPDAGTINAWSSIGFKGIAGLAAVVFASAQWVDQTTDQQADAVTRIDHLQRDMTELSEAVGSLADAVDEQRTTSHQIARLREQVSGLSGQIEAVAMAAEARSDDRLTLTAFTGWASELQRLNPGEAVPNPRNNNQPYTRPRYQPPATD
jgi:methyl-accepting chemotaxis protein